MRLLTPDKITTRESKHQEKFVEYVKKRGLGDCLIAIPNGAHLAGDARRRAMQMAGLKRQGLRPGASDLFFAKPVSTYHGAWFEMKSETGITSQDQREFLVLMRFQGYYVAVCHGAKDAAMHFERYLKGQACICVV